MNNRISLAAMRVPSNLGWALNGQSWTKGNGANGEGIDALSQHVRLKMLSIYIFGDVVPVMEYWEVASPGRMKIKLRMRVRSG